MNTHIVYMMARNGTRYTSEFLTADEAARLVRQIENNGGTAEAFPADDRPMLFAWMHDLGMVYRVMHHAMP